MRCRGEEEKLSDVQSAWLDVSLLPILATLPAVSAFAANAMDAADNLSATTTYVPSAMDAGDGWAQFVVLMVTALCGLVGMKVSFDGEQTASQDAISERVAKQVAAMETAETIPVIGVPLGDLKDRLAVSGAASSLDTDGLLRIDGVLSPDTAKALLAEVNATLERELARAGQGSLPSDSFGNVYCKGNRYDLKLPLRGVAEAALREAVLNMGPVLEKVAGGNAAKLCEFAALVSDPGSTRQPVHPDTNYRRDRCVVTTFVACRMLSQTWGPPFSFLAATPREHISRSRKPTRWGDHHWWPQTVWQLYVPETCRCLTLACCTVVGVTLQISGGCCSTFHLKLAARRTPTLASVAFGTS